MCGVWAHLCDLRFQHSLPFWINSSCSRRWPPPKTNAGKIQNQNAVDRNDVRALGKYSPGSDLCFNPKGNPDVRVDGGWCEQICWWMRERMEETGERERENLEREDEQMKWIGTRDATLYFLECGTGLSGARGRRALARWIRNMQ